MANLPILPRDLPDAVEPLQATDVFIVDQGAGALVSKVKAAPIVDSVAPLATEADAQIGTNNIKRMSPLRTKQAIASEVGVSIASYAAGQAGLSAVQSVNGKSGTSVTLNKSDIGLANVDNTSDANKPVSTAQLAALNLKANNSVIISGSDGLTGGGDLTVSRSISLSPSSVASLALADSAVQPSITITAGTGLAGGGTLAANRTIALSTTSIASLAKADSAVQPAVLNDYATLVQLATKFDKPAGNTSQYIRGDGSIAAFPAIPQGTVTSVGLISPAGFSVSGSPVTSTGTLALSYASGYQGYTTAESTKLAGLNSANYAPVGRTITAGAGLTGGGDLSANRSIALNPTSIASLAKADTATQPSDLGALATKDKVSVPDINATGTPNNESFLRGDGTWSPVAGAGTVTSVAMTVPTGLAVAGSPITGAGTFSVSYASGYQGYTASEATKLAGVQAGAQVNSVTSVAGRTGAVTLVKGDVGLGNVDNTSDASKPVSTATQTALNAKANSSVTVSAGTGLTGGGNLTANRSIALNASSIASLGKADTAIQAPGGTTGQILAKSSNTTNDVGWVSSEAATAVSYASQTLTDAQKSQARANIDADKVYNTISDVQSAVIDSSVMAIRTNGYQSAGDGGGALYKKVVTEPAHAGKIQTSDGEWLELDMRNGVNVLQFGAKGNGSGDDFQAIQNAINAMSMVGGIVHVPRGTYNLSDGLSIIQNTVNWHDTKRVSFIGDGSGLTRFYYTGAVADKAVIDWSTSNALDTDGTYGNSWARIGGFSVEATNKANYGLRTTAKSWFEANDIKIIGAVEKNFYFRSTVSWSGRSLRSYGSKIGMHAELSDAPLAYSVPNNITLIDCTIGNATVWGIHARNCGPINLIGGSIEGNGSQGVDASGGTYIIRNDVGIGIEAVAMNIHGTYFEHNAGGADVYVSQQSNTFPCIVNVVGANFNRVDSAKYTTNNIRLEVLSTSYGRINLVGSGFNYGGSYSPNAARRCLSLTGNPSNNGNQINYDKATVFRSATDGPGDLNGNWDIPKALVFASCRVEANGLLARKHNVGGIVKGAPGSGRYTVNFNYPASSGSPQVVGSVVGGAGSISTVMESAASVTIEVRNESGVPTDQAFSLHVTDA